MEACKVRINLEKLAKRQNSERRNADFWPVSRLGLSWNFKAFAVISIVIKVLDIIVYIVKIMWWGLKRIQSGRSRDIQNRAKIQNLEWSCSKTGVEKTRLVSFLDRQKSQAVKNDIKQHSKAS